MNKAIINEEEVKKEIQEFIGNSGFFWLIKNVEEIDNKQLSNFEKKMIYPTNIPYNIRESLERSGSWEDFIKNQVLDSAKKGVLRGLENQTIEKLCEEKNYADNTIHKLNIEESQEFILNLVLEELVKRNRKNLLLIVDSSFWNEAEIKSFRNKEIFEKINNIQTILTEDNIKKKRLKNDFLFILVSKKQTPIVPYHILGIKNEQDMSSLNTYFFFHVWYGKKLDKPLNAFAFTRIKKQII